MNQRGSVPEGTGPIAFRQAELTCGTYNESFGSMPVSWSFCPLEVT